MLKASDNPPMTFPAVPQIDLLTGEPLAQAMQRIPVPERVVSAIVRIVYATVLVALRGATLGKMVLGLRVRPWDRLTRQPRTRHASQR